tara:strand:- start:46 stop:957 length:912 start_codon:yes stop_codon:yes gene_type:complete
MTRVVGRSLELFYIDGHADGMLTAELFNWMGHVLMAPRTQLADALKRSEPKCTGVYLLLGDKEGAPCAYIGESDDVGQRLKSHDVKKDWWTSVFFVTTSGNKLNKAHVRYLEARLIGEAKRIGRVDLDNGTAPPIPSLSEADQAKMEEFLANLLSVLPALRVDMFVERKRPSLRPAADPTPEATYVPIFVLENKKHNLRAKARLEYGEFVVEAGSEARLNWEGAAHHNYANLHSELKHSGVLKPDGARNLFADNYAFSSPSAAAAVIDGRAANGTVEWKLEASGETYKEWEARYVGADEEVPA